MGAKTKGENPKIKERNDQETEIDPLKAL